MIQHNTFYYDFHVFFKETENQEDLVACQRSQGNYLNSYYLTSKAILCPPELHKLLIVGSSYHFYSHFFLCLPSDSLFRSHTNISTITHQDVNIQASKPLPSLCFPNILSLTTLHCHGSIPTLPLKRSWNDTSPRKPFFMSRAYLIVTSFVLLYRSNHPSIHTSVSIPHHHCIYLQ